MLLNEETCDSSPRELVVNNKYMETHDNIKQNENIDSSQLSQFLNTNCTSPQKQDSAINQNAGTYNYNNNYN